MLGDGGHAPRAPVAWVAVLVVLAARVGEAPGPLCGYASRDPDSDYLLEAVGPDGEELCSVVEDSVSYRVCPHAAADLLLFLKDRDADARVLESVGGDEAGETRAYYDARLHAL